MIKREPKTRTHWQIKLIQEIELNDIIAMPCTTVAQNRRRKIGGMWDNE